MHITVGVFDDGDDFDNQFDGISSAPTEELQHMLNELISTVRSESEEETDRDNVTGMFLIRS